MQKKEIYKVIKRPIAEGTISRDEVPKSEHPPRERHRSLSEAIADSDVYILNWYYAGSAIDFPHHPEMRLVDRYFPYAKGGALLIDAPQDNQDLDLCKKKSIALRAKGYRYLILTKHMNLNDAMDELAKIDKELKRP